MQQKSLVSGLREKISSIDTTLIVLCGIVIIAGIIRFYNINKVGLRFYDEGFALIDARTFLQGGKLRIKLPHVLLISIGFRIFGIYDYVGVSVSAFMGTMTIFLIFLIGKTLYNENTGLLASAMLTVTEYHILYSRCALAYSNLIFFMLLSFFLIIKGIKIYENNSLNSSYELSLSPIKITIHRSSLFYILGGIFTGISATITLFGLLLIPFIIFIILILMGLRMIKIKKTLFLSTIFIITTFLSFFSFFIFLYLFNRLFITAGIAYYSQSTLGTQWGQQLTLTYYFFFISELVNPIFILLSILGLISCFQKKSIFDIILVASFAYFLIIFSSIPNIWPRTFVISVPFLILLAARGFFIELPKNFKKINFNKFKIIIPLTLVLMSLGLFYSIDTVNLESPAYNEVSIFLLEDNCRGGLTTATQILEFYTGQKWDWLKSKDQIFSVYSQDFSHIVIDYMYYHTGYEIAREILEKCTPIYVINNDIASHEITLLETFSIQTVQEMLEDPYINYIYVYKMENVLRTLNGD